MANFGFATEGIDVVKAFPEQVKGKTFIITGPSPGGIGAETVTTLAHGKPATLILLGRSRAKCEPVLAAVAAIDASITTQFVPVDLASLASVRAAAATILSDASVPHIHALINNAGVMMCPQHTTPDGVELQFAASHLGHWLLSNLLLPKLRAAAAPGVGQAQARIVNVASSGNKMGGMRWTDPAFQQPGSYDAVSAYGQAKTAAILGAVGFNARLQRAPAAGGVRALALHPGSIATNLQVHLTGALVEDAAARVYGPGLDMSKDLPPVKTLAQGCATTLVAALDPAMSVEGEERVFLDDCQLTTPETSAVLAKYAVDAGDAEKLWKMSEDMVGEKFEP